MNDNKINENTENEEIQNDVATDVEVTEEEQVAIQEDATPIKASKSSSAKQSIAASFTSKKFKGGAYATIISTIVIVLILVVNLVATELNLSVDLTASGKYTLEDETVTFVKALKDKITLYYMVESGAETKEIAQVIDKYSNINSNITVVRKDPIQYPKFASQYVEGVGTLARETIIVVNETNDRVKMVEYEDMIITNYDYTTYESTSTSDVEGQIDSALQFVTNEKLPVMYNVTSHGETAISSTLASTLAKENVTTTELDTLTADSIPEDCNILFINTPLYDYTEDEVTLIKNYLIAGGNAIIVFNNLEDELPIFESLLNYYGVDIVPGIVVETDSSYYKGTYAYDLLPAITTHDITSGIKGKKYVDVPEGSGIAVRDDIRSTITTTSLLTSSEDAFSKVDLNSSTLTQEANDIAGQFSVAMLIEETYNEVESKIVVYSGYVFHDSFMTATTYGNAAMLKNTINYLADVESTLSIPTTDLSTEATLTLTAAQIKTNVLICVVLLPLLMIALGIIVTVRRRRK